MAVLVDRLRLSSHCAAATTRHGIGLLCGKRMCRSGGRAIVQQLVGVGQRWRRRIDKLLYNAVVGWHRVSSYSLYRERTK
jgi:hypothetical protein